MDNVKRLSLDYGAWDEWGQAPHLFEDPDGDYILYTDHLKILNTNLEVRAQLAASKADADRLAEAIQGWIDTDDDEPIQEWAKIKEALAAHESAAKGGM